MIVAAQSYCIGSGSNVITHCEIFLQHTLRLRPLSMIAVQPCLLIGCDTITRSSLSAIKAATVATDDGNSTRLEVDLIAREWISNQLYLLLVDRE